MSDYNINGLAIPLFLVLMLAEFILLKVQGKKVHRYNDSINSLTMGMCLLISDALLKAYTFAVFVYLWENHRLFDFATHEPVTWFIFFIALDICYYWFHRIAHEVNILWGAHVGHHQSEEYNFTTALRQSAFQYAFSWVFYLPLALLGCPPIAFIVLFILLKVYQFWLHTQSVDKLPLVEGIFSTPSSHRVHHAKNPIYIDRNYGGTLVIWDRLFGTWQPELSNEVCHYGTTEPLNTLDPIKANLQHWSMLATDTYKTDKWRDKIRLWFKPTGWRPKDCTNSNNSNRILQSNGCEQRRKFDPKVASNVNIYIGINFLILIAITSAFVFLSPQLDRYLLITSVFTIIYGFVAISHFLEGKVKLYWFEVVRLPLTLWLTYSLWLILLAQPFFLHK